MHDPVRLQVIWDDPDIELRLMKALIALVEASQLKPVGRHTDPAALKRVGEWFNARCKAEVEATNG